MKEILLIRYGEIGVKGKNKYIFENKLAKNIRNAVSGFEGVQVEKSQGRVYVIPNNNSEIEQLIGCVKKVFGIVGICRVFSVESDIEVIKEYALKCVMEDLAPGETFKIATRRADKEFPYNSLEMNQLIGSYIFDNIEDLHVDVHKPDLKVVIEVRGQTYIYSNKREIKGLGGMPMGTNGKGVLLLSGGIDSPVAGYMIGKRGVEIIAAHFMSPPYTSERAKDKVIELAKIVAQYTGNLKLYLIPFTDIQMQIYEKCKENQTTLIMRRYMMRIAEMISKKEEANCLITGESIGQVASQTMQGLVVTNSAVNLPVFRPLIGFDKQEIVEVAEKIGTFETSILPYEDCCTVFVPKHPDIKPKLEYIEKSEQHLEGIEKMLNDALINAEIVEI